MALPANAQRYLQKFGVKGPWVLNNPDRTGFAGAVVIPALAEGDSLFTTLDALAQNPAQSREAFAVIVVVNHGEGANQKEVQQNALDLARLDDYASRSDLNLVWIDAASPGQALPRKHAGVGLARKIGLDRALTLLCRDSDPLLVCLDADTWVEDNYLEIIRDHFCSSPAGAAVLPYRHRCAETPEQQRAIDHYEIFLRSYVFGLRLAGSPYAFNSVGSAMACRATAYVRAGGMNTRKAGEDFYFLQKLAKTDGVATLEGTTVMPSPRVSTRVPFGTGRSMSRMLENDYKGVLIYPVEVFQVLQEWLDLVTANLTADGGIILKRARGLSMVLSDYLETQEWQRHWAMLQKTYQGAALLEAFHVWFDGFRSLRLIHTLCEQDFQRGEAESLLPHYFAMQGLSCPESASAILESLRQTGRVLNQGH